MGGWGMGGLRVSKARLGGCTLHSHRGSVGWGLGTAGLQPAQDFSPSDGPWLTGALPGLSSVGEGGPQAINTNNDSHL